MRELPAGTVTFLFTDIEGSTRVLQELGAAYADELAAHRTALRKAFGEHDGVEVDTQGDAFLYAFARASDAAAAARAGQDALADSALRVRMGLHTGEPIVTDEGYVGIDVHRGARVMSAGHGGQVLLSASTRSFLADGVAVVDLGLHRLKDLGEPERLYQLGEGDFPPLRTLDPTNLPVAANPLLGRERQLGELTALLAEGARLVTVTGPGGTGKTRLALQVAAELVGSVDDGVFWVPLAGLSDPALVPAEVAGALGAPEDPAMFLRNRRVLLLLDNLEHLLDSAPTLGALLAACEGLQLLVTSRAPLRIAGEREYLLEPLEPDAAVELFLERARSVGRELDADATLDAICRRLDGLPLAIELAAARTKLLNAETLLARLERALPLLTGGGRDAPERQRTLRATIDWSYDLLDDRAQGLFARLAVFAGGFSLAAAEEVCDADLDALAALVDLSLLKAIGDDRFLLLETIREDAVERLPAEAMHVLGRRHAAYFAAVAEEARRRRFDAEAEWSARLELDHDDLRVALDRLAAADGDGELTLAGALGWFWLSHSHLAEGSRRLAGALDRSPADVRPARARALAAAGAIAGQEGDRDLARARFHEAIEQWRVLDDEAELAVTLDAFGWMLFFGDANDESLDVFERSLAIRRELGDLGGETRALAGVCQVLVAQGHVERAEGLSQELLELARGHDDVRSEHFALHYLADCALIRSEFALARERYRESLDAVVALGDVLETSFEVQGVAMSSAGLGELELAVRLGAAVDALWESRGIVVSVAFWDDLVARHIGGSRAMLGAAGDAVWAEGRSLDFDEAVRVALERSA